MKSKQGKDMNDYDLYYVNKLKKKKNKNKQTKYE